MLMILRAACFTAFLIATVSASCQHSITACEHQADVRVSCPSDKVIEVLDAFYGRRDSNTCGYNGNINCVASGSLKIIENKCQGMNSCTLEANNGLFGDPCRGVSKYIKMDYKCVPEQRYIPNDALACEHRADLTVTCPEDEVILVVDGFYGRDEAESCPGVTSNTDCTAEGSLEILKRNCNNQRSCVLQASNSIFGDPCVSTNKFIKMIYYCVKRGEDLEPQEALACEHQDNVQVSCPAGNVMLVADGFYGRDEAESCPGNIYSTECFADGSVDILRCNCDNARSCILEASNSVFGDPCRHTTKLIKMEYYCVPQPGLQLHHAVACEHHSDVTVSCSGNGRIKVIDGFYGRDDHATCPGNVFTTDCAAEGSLDILKDTCNGASSCTISASNGVFGDPCINTNKFIKMAYYCVEV